MWSSWLFADCMMNHRDMEVFAPLPPLSLFTKQYDLYFPTRTPWGGVPASMVVCPRGENASISVRLL